MHIHFSAQSSPTSSNIYTHHNHKTQQITKSPQGTINNNPHTYANKIIFYSNRPQDHTNIQNNHIYMMDVQQKEKVYKLTHGNENNYDPIFGMDGQQVFYKSNRDNGMGNIWGMKVLVEEEKVEIGHHYNITKQMAGEQWKPELVGQSILLFTNNINCQSQIYKMDLQKYKICQLTNNNVPNWYPSYSPFLKQIIFVSRQSPNNIDQLYAMNLDGQNRRKISKLAGDSADPFCLPNSSQIIFINSGSSGKYQLYKMDIKKGQIDKILLEQFIKDDILGPSVQYNL